MLDVSFCVPIYNIMHYSCFKNISHLIYHKIYKNIAEKFFEKIFDKILTNLFVGLIIKHSCKTMLHNGVLH